MQIAPGFYHVAPPSTHQRGFQIPVVRVSWFEGKDSATKKAVAAEITESIVKNTGTEPMLAGI